VHENAIVLLLRRAVWFARVVNPPPCVTALARVDDVAVLQQIVERMIGILRVVCWQVSRFLTGDARAGVFDNASAFAN